MLLLLSVVSMAGGDVRKRVTRLRSRRSRAGRSSLGKIVWRVRRVFFVCVVVLRSGLGDWSGGVAMEVIREVRMSLVLGRPFVLSGAFAMVAWLAS